MIQSCNNGKRKSSPGVYLKFNTYCYEPYIMIQSSAINERGSPGVYLKLKVCIRAREKFPNKLVFK